jgi:hypothetical protein
VPHRVRTSKPLKMRGIEPVFPHKNGMDQQSM